MAKIECIKHGSTGGTLVSPDIALHINLESSMETIKLILIKVESFLNEPVIYWISENFSQQYNNVDFNNILHSSTLRKLNILLMIFTENSNQCAQTV